MRIRRSFDEETLGFIWDRDKSRVNRYIDDWAPKWGEAGRDLSNLPLTPGYLEPRARLSHVLH